MSTTTKQSERTFTQAEADDLHSLFSPNFDPRQAQAHTPAFATNQIKASTPAKTFLPSDLQPTFNDPLLKPYTTLQTHYVPKAEYVKARRSARDAWFAVMVLGMVIAGGLYFIVDRVGGDAAKINVLTTKIDGLTKQIAGERAVVLARNKEVNLLRDQLNDERKKNSPDGLESDRDEITPLEERTKNNKARPLKVGAQTA